MVSITRAQREGARVPNVPRAIVTMKEGWGLQVWMSEMRLKRARAQEGRKQNLNNLWPPLVKKTGAQISPLLSMDWSPTFPCCSFHGWDSMAQFLPSWLLFISAMEKYQGKVMNQGSAGMAFQKPLRSGLAPLLIPLLFLFLPNVF